MPAHTAQPGSRTHRPARLATWAAAAVIALLAAACTSTASTSTSSPDTAPTPSSGSPAWTPRHSWRRGHPHATSDR